jgi:hypothetical protein
LAGVVFATVVSMAGSAAAASGAAARPTLWWQPRASEFWVVNHAAIVRLFANGQCTQWAAEKRPGLVRRMIVRRIAAEVRAGRPEVLPNLDARNWPADARSVGVPTGTTPVRGALMVFQPGVLGAGADGHIAYVQRVYPDGSFEISQMNAPTPYQVTRERLPGWTSFLVGIRFIYRAP